MSATHPDRPFPDDALAARLRLDAASWEAAPSLAARSRLRAIPRQRPWRTPILAAAAAVIVGTIAMAWPRERVPTFVRPRIDVAQIEAIALLPLERELEHLVHDGQLVVDGVWRHVPSRLRGLIAAR